MTPMTTDTDRHCIDLTQLSSREQLSALMDGALPEDQTRFLLRRLQHDAPRAGCWERWRIAGVARRGVAPAHRLPNDFAERVAAALHGEHAAASHPVARRPAWLRWGGGAAMAAALAVVALMARPQLESTPSPQGADAPAVQLAANPASVPAAPKTPPQPSAPMAEAPAMLAAAVAVAAKPVRRTPARSTRPAPAPASAPDLVADRTPAVALHVDPPSPEIATRPWPRSILSQYGGNSGLTVGFGEHLPRAADNPFAPSVFGAPPTLSSEPKPAPQAPDASPAQDDPSAGARPQP
jgi:negative regulator of sigma E activity